MHVRMNVTMSVPASIPRKMTAAVLEPVPVAVVETVAVTHVRAINNMRGINDDGPVYDPRRIDDRGNADMYVDVHAARLCFLR